MKRWISLLLAMTLVLGLCVPMTLATPDEQFVAGWPVPTNLRWSDSGQMLWEGEHPETYHFDGYFISIRYAAGTSDAEPAEADWETFYSSGEWQRTYLRHPNISEFSLPGDGWYSFSLVSFGEYTNDEGYCTLYYGSGSGWSEPKYFELADPMEPPFALVLDGTNFSWSVGDAEIIDYYRVEMFYLEQDMQTGEKVECTFRTGTVTPRYNETTVTRNVLDMFYLDEENLLQYGSREYYFKLCAVSEDKTIAGDSEWVTCSDTLRVNDGATKLSTPTGMAWVDNTMTWNFVEGQTYDVQLYFQRTELSEEEKEEIGAAGGSVEITETWELELFENITSTDDFPVLNNRTGYGIGNYHFTVRARSNDLSKYLSSDWSEPSGIRYRNGDDVLPMAVELGWTENGDMTWTWEGTDAQQAYLDDFTVRLYFRAADSETASECNSMRGENPSASDFNWKRYASQDGYYSFSVRANSSDMDQYYGSEMTQPGAELWYDAPDPLPAPTNLRWEGTTAVWDALAEQTYVNRYRVKLYRHSSDGKDEVRSVSISPEDTRYVFEIDAFEEDGVYTFGVYAEPSDPLAWSVGTEGLCATRLTFNAATEKLPAPTGLFWDTTDGSTAKWTVPEDTSGIAGYRIRFVGSESERTFAVEVGEFYTMTSYLASVLGDNITFQVCALSSDYTTYLDSDWSQCGESYTMPALAAPTDVKWDGNSMSWSWNGDADMRSGYRVSLYYAADEAEEPELLDSWYFDTNKTVSFETWGAYARKPGLYYFTVVARSRNTNTVSNSAESAMSAAFPYTPPAALAPPTNLAWDGARATWTASTDENAAQMDGYSVVLQEYSPYGDRYYNVISLWTQDCTVSFPSNVFEEGTVYRFTVTACSRKPLERINSNEAVCATTFTYKDPGKTLDTPAGLYWDSGFMVWDLSGQEHAAYYEYEVYGSERDYTWSGTVEPGSFPAVSATIFNRCGSKLQFRVRAVTNDANAVSNSEWSEYSDVFTYDGNPFMLSAPKNLTYDADTSFISWDKVNGATEYKIEVWYSETAGGESKLNSRQYTLDNEYQMVANEGLGYYTVKVMAISNYTTFEDSEWAEYTFQLSEAKTLEAPAELTWGVYRYENENRTVPGVVSWKRGFDQASYRVRIYRVNENGEAVRVGGSSYNFGGGESSEYFSDTSLLNCDLESGTYYFTVQARGDGEAFLDSEEVRSENWIYVKPAAALPTLTGTAWLGNTMTWDMPADKSLFFGYEIEIWYSENRYSEQKKISTMTADSFTESEELSRYLVSKYGDGCYWFKVRGLSADVTSYNAGEYTALCGPCALNEASADINDFLSSFMQDIPYIEREDVIYILKNEINMTRLAEAMSSDVSGNSTAALVGQLEEQFGGTVGIDVSETLGMDENAISVVGAALNAAGTTGVTLKISEAEGIAVPAGYTNAVPFSMYLEGGVDNDGESGNQVLSVPVQITLPVPASVNPAYLVMLHENGDTTEVIRPYVYEKDGQWYACVVVTSFSDFAFANAGLEAKAVSGGVEVNVSLAVDVPGSAVCAVYDEDGRQLGIEVVPAMGAGEQTVSVTCDTTKAAQVKLFLLDTGCGPMHEAACENIQK